jgi:hypothetical protein
MADAGIALPPTIATAASTVTATLRQIFMTPAYEGHR